MTTVLLIIHLFVTLALIGVVLIQRSEGGGLGIGTSQGMGGFMSGRGTANLLTRTTAVLATIFMALSLTLALLNRGTTVNNRSSILDAPPTPAIPTPATPLPGAPSPPLPQAIAPIAAPPATTTLPTTTPPTTAPPTTTPPGATPPGALPQTTRPQTPAP